MEISKLLHEPLQAMGGPSTWLSAYLVCLLVLILWLVWIATRQHDDGLHQPGCFCPHKPRPESHCPAAPEPHAGRP